MMNENKAFWEEEENEAAKAIDFIHPAFHDEFEKHIQFLWGQLLLLNERTVILEQIKKFRKRGLKGKKCSIFTSFNGLICRCLKQILCSTFEKL